MIYTTAQRDFIQNRIIASVQDQVRIYSARQVSLRGRATIMNTLITTKTWHCLRLLQPTQAFLRTLRSIIYKYVWSDKRPLVSFDQLCLPFSQGGVGLISPEVQHLVLQIRHLIHLFGELSSPSVLVRPFIQYHMSLILDHQGPASLSFFVPELRKRDLNHPTSIINSC
jgi:hypothetical protein